MPTTARRLPAAVRRGNGQTVSQTGSLCGGSNSRRVLVGGAVAEGSVGSHEDEELVVEVVAVPNAQGGAALPAECFPGVPEGGEAINGFAVFLPLEAPQSPAAEGWPGEQGLEVVGDERGEVGVHRPACRGLGSPAAVVVPAAGSGPVSSSSTRASSSRARAASPSTRAVIGRRRVQGFIVGVGHRANSHGSPATC